ncbi:hypothetical protein EGM_00145 [Macaca fascicularis]|uniref:Uncharacterized protein n=1 Tax=Macaca fascicularis TaxID=9541 RepID=G7NTA2_MACFA|nr:hypothetical protein EGM_00145 [Macaca fascicularis]
MGKGVRPALPQRKSPAERGWAGAGGGGALGLLPWILRSRHHFPAQIRTQIRLPWLQGAQSCSQLAARTLDGRSALWPLPLLFLAPEIETVNLNSLDLLPLGPGGSLIQAQPGSLRRCRKPPTTPTRVRPLLGRDAAVVEPLGVCNRELPRRWGQ